MVAEAERKTILVVVDNPDDVMLIRRTLAQTDIGHDVVLARDGAEALEYLFGAQPERIGAGTRPLPAAVVLDLKLPRVNGAEVLRRLRADERTRALPVLVVSPLGGVGGVGPDDDHELLRAAADFGQFREAVRQLGVKLMRASASA
jgi:two-component system response regulator